MFDSSTEQDLSSLKEEVKKWELKPKA
jgi:hypothetical protein